MNAAIPILAEVEFLLNCFRELVRWGAEAIFGAAAMSEAVEAAIERLREKLIDLTANNRLLNFRHGAGTAGSRSVLRFVGKPPDQVFARLRDQKSFYVQPVPEPTTKDLVDFYREPGGIPGLESDDARNRSRPDPARWAKYRGCDVEYELPVETDDSDQEERPADNRIRALLYPDQLEARLRRLRSNARLAVEESGSNMLFLALGFLEWRDQPSQTRKDDVRAYQAPLILVPAAIETETTARGRRRFTVSWSGEDLQTNLSLRKKLSVDFGIELAEFGDADMPEAYFDRVRRAISSQPLWRVRRLATLTLFTNLGKLLLYLDLDHEKWPSDYKPADHPIVSSLLGEGNAPHVSSDPSIDERAVAKMIDLDLCLVDRADGTQARALLHALSGRNLVIQGPPGTGKSQTITNLIAAALQRGKTVLFVAEKLAALEVVRRRLREVGLGDFCLELHSHKTRKKSFFEDIKTRLEKRPVGMSEQYDVGLRALAARRAELDDYAVAVSRRAGQTGLTTADLLFEAGHTRVTDPALTKTVDEIGLAEKVATACDTLSIDRYAEREAVRALERAVQAARDLAAFGGPARCPWRGVRPESQLAIDLRAGQRRLAEWRDRAQLASDAIAKLTATAGISLPSRRSTFEQLRPLAECSGSLPALFTLGTEAQAAFDELSKIFNFQFDAGLRGFTQAVRVVELAASAPNDALPFGHDGLDVPGARNTLERLDEALGRRAEIVASLQRLIEKPDADDLEETRLRAAGKLLIEANVFARFGAEWREARRFARALLALGAPKKPRVQGEALLVLANRVAIDRDLDNDTGIRTACGVHFCGPNTEVSKLRSALAWRERVQAAFPDRPDRGIRENVLGARPVDLVDIRDYASGPLIQLKALIDELFSNGGGNRSTNLWSAIACHVAPRILADVLAS